MTTKQAWGLLYALHDAIEASQDGNVVDVKLLVHNMEDARAFAHLGLELANAYLESTANLLIDNGLRGMNNEAYTYDLQYELEIKDKALTVAEKANGVCALGNALNRVANIAKDLHILK